MICDAAVIGAGPAGSFAALHIARAGLSVVLVDKARFPRDKVCGCCLSAASLATLAAAGLGSLVDRLGAAPLHTLRLASGSVRVDLPIASKSVSRSTLDNALVQAAVAEGVTFIAGTAATVNPDQTVALGTAGLLSPRAVLISDGIAGTALRQFPILAPRAARRARIGVSAILPADTPGFEPYRIHMIVGRRGYVGAVRLEDQRLNVAAAIDPRFIRERGSPGSAVDGILGSAGMAGLGTAHFSGTPTLTRRRGTLQHGSLFILGDAASYVEPFTGEGIAWALASARAIAPHIVAHVTGRAACWTREYRGLIAPRQRLCRAVAWALRSPLLTRATIRALSLFPRLASPALGRASAAFEEATA